MTAHRLLASTLESLAALFALFLAHRLLTMGVLSSTELTPTIWGEAFIVGLLSDFWVAFLGSVIVLSVTCALTFTGHSRLAFWARLGVLGAFALAFAAHHGYVDYYHAQIAPFHLRYLLDRDFLRANGSSILSLKSLLTFATPFVATFFLLFLDLFRDNSVRRLTVYMAGLAAIALFAHNRNIHYRVQWFVQDSLQTNAVERLYLRVKYASLPLPLSKDEMLQLANAIGNAPPLSPETPTANDLMKVLTKPVHGSQGAHVVASALRDEFSRQVAAGNRPIVLVALLESLRPSETGYFAPKSPAVSLTPRLDEAVKHGVVFTRAFSSGSVTRGGQEAVFCGYMGSRETSLLRGQTAANVGCLPDLLRNLPAPPDVFWYHGGEGRFDNQLAFWQGRGIVDALSLKDFKDSDARSDWGIGDQTFFAAAGKRLNALVAKSRAPYLVGMTLSVSNHIPWAVPPDAKDFAPTSGLTHPSYATTLYTDRALGDFVDGLKNGGLWDKTLLIVASDHGNNIPPYNDLYIATSQRQAFLQSHINFALVGGIAEAALKSQHLESLTLNQVVSQVDIATLIASVIGLDDVRFMGENPFEQNRTLPVISVLEEDLFDPRAPTSYPQRAAAKMRATDVDSNRATPILYFRAFLQYINTWSSRASG